VTSVVLIAHSLMWPNAALLAIAFRNAGFVVEAIAPEGHPIHKMRSPDRAFVYRSFSPRASLRRAIEVSKPQLIVPCDDRVVGHLHALHAASAEDPASAHLISEAIESSLGSPKTYPLLRQRRSLSALAALPDVHIPRTDPIASFGELKDWVATYGLPAVLKLDGSTGGEDVVLARDDADLAVAYLNMRLRRSGLRHLATALRKRNLEPLLGYARGGPRGVVVQSFVAGRPANCSVACWRGEVLTSVAVEVVQSRPNFGVATVVRPVEGPAMKAAARSIVRHLNLSGLCGFDFVIDEASGQAKLIEINPRATQTHHDCFGSGLDPARALYRVLNQGANVVDVATEPSPAEVVLFPHNPLFGPDSASFADARYDMPLEEPELMKFYHRTLPAIEQPSFAGAAIASQRGEESRTLRRAG
jgi:hypothetical protein